MTANEQRRSEEQPGPATPAPGADKAPAGDAADAAVPKGLDYVFKFAPADPKNTFDFEDVADK